METNGGTSLVFSFSASSSIRRRIERQRFVITHGAALDSAADVVVESPSVDGLRR